MGKGKGRGRVIQTLEQRMEAFWSKVAIAADDNQCWLWIAPLKSEKYPSFWWNGKTNKSHHVAWILPDYVIPDGMYILHSCDKPTCCNPRHLRIGTAQENMDDKVIRGRQSRGETHGMSILTDAQRIEIQRRFAAGERNISKLGREFGISHSAAYYIVHGKKEKNHE